MGEIFEATKHGFKKHLWTIGSHEQFYTEYFFQPLRIRAIERLEQAPNFRCNFNQESFLASSNRTEPASGEGIAHASQAKKPVSSMRRRDHPCRD
jgi:hypothetical protein